MPRGLPAGFAVWAWGLSRQLFAGMKGEICNAGRGRCLNGLFVFGVVFSHLIFQEVNDEPEDEEYGRDGASRSVEIPGADVCKSNDCCHCHHTKNYIFCLHCVWNVQRGAVSGSTDFGWEFTFLGIAPREHYFGFVSETLVVNEIYLSLQGESTFAGLPCVFVRLTACNLRCSYCDTAYAFTEGSKMEVQEVRRQVLKIAAQYADSGTALKLPLIEFTGGEPLLQKGVLPLMTQFCDEGFTVLVETSGALDISQVDKRVRRIMDIKTLSSGESDRNRWANIEHLQAMDEVKFVIGTREDYDWSKEIISKHHLTTKCPLLFSWVAPLSPHQQHSSLKKVPEGLNPITRQELVELIIADALPVRFQLQMHKFIWAPEARGV